MADERNEVRTINYRFTFPWTELFRALRLGRDPTKFLLGGFGIVLMLLGWWVIAELLGPRGLSENLAQEYPWSSELLTINELDPARPLEIVEGFAQSPVDGLEYVFFDWGPRRVIHPMRMLMRPLEGMAVLEPAPTSPEDELTADPEERAAAIPGAFGDAEGDAPFSRYLAVLLMGLWAILVWGFFGGAITRIAAVQVARDEKIGLFEALRFAARKYFSFIGAALVPLIAIVLIVLIAALGGLISLIPVAGDLFAGILWLLPLLAGFVIALILLGLALGWPLMVVTVSAEGSDTFDALSRSYSYIFQRPWHYLFYAIVTVLYGAAAIFFAFFVAHLLVYFSGWAVSWGAGAERTREFFAWAPAGWANLFGPPPTEVTGTDRIGAFLVGGVWLHLVAVLLIGFLYSFFWSAATIVYFLLRRNVDATDLDEVYMEEEEEEDFMVPPAGPEAELPVVEGAAGGEAHAGPTSSGPGESQPPPPPRSEERHEPPG